MKKWDVINMGIIVVDVPVRIPAKVLDFQTDTLRSQDISILPGGDAVNSSLVLSRLGKKTALCGAVGEDLFGSVLKYLLANEQIDVSCVRAKKGVATSVSVVMINAEGERTFVCTKGNNPTLCAQDLDFGMLEQARMLNLSSVFAHPKIDRTDGVGIFETAKNAGLYISADTAHDHEQTGLAGVAPMLRYVDYFMPSYVEARSMTGERDPQRQVREIIRQTGEKIVIVKLGGEGCFVHEKNREYTVGALDVPVVDTTGAGDTFVGAFLSARLDGRSVEQSVRYAVCASAVCVQHVGAVSEKFTKEAVEELYRKHF